MVERRRRIHWLHVRGSTPEYFVQKIRLFAETFIVSCDNPPTLQIFGLHGVTQLEILETEEVTLLYIAVRSQSIEGVTGTRVLRSRYGSHVAILTPAPVDRCHLVFVGTHIFSLHSGKVDHLVTDAEIEIGLNDQRP